MVANICFFLSTRCLSLEHGIEFHLGRGALDTLAGRQVTARRAGSARRLSWSFPRGRTVLSSRSSGFRGARPRVRVSAAHKPQKAFRASASRHAAHGRELDGSRRAGGAGRLRPETQERAQRARGAFPSPSRASRATARARAARRPAASFDRAVPSSPQSAWFPVVSVVSGF